MKNILIILFSIVSCVPLAWCTQMKSDEEKGNQIKWVDASISVEAKLNDTEYVVNTPIILELSIHNNSQIFIVQSTPFKQYKFSILDENTNKAVPLTRWGKHVQEQDFFKRSIYKIAPGESYSESLNIARYFDLSFTSRYSIEIGGEYLNHSKKFVSYNLKELKFSVKEK